MKIEYPSRVFTEEEVKNMWNESWGDSYPYVLRGERGSVNKYTTDNVLNYVAYETDGEHKGKIVGICGWVDYGDWVAIGGLRVYGGINPKTGKPRQANYRNQKVSTTLLDKLLNKIGSKPTIVAVNNKNISEAWDSAFERRGFVRAPSNNVVSIIPNEVLDYHRNKYGQKWFVLQSTAMAKAWNIVKSIDERMVIFFMED